MCRTWVWTVFSVMNSVAATSRLVWPCATRAATRRSVSVSLSPDVRVADLGELSPRLVCPQRRTQAFEDAEGPAE